MASDCHESTDGGILSLRCLAGVPESDVALICWRYNCRGVCRYTGILRWCGCGHQSGILLPLCGCAPRTLFTAAGRLRAQLFLSTRCD